MFTVPCFEAKDLSAIRSEETAATERLAEVSAQLASLIDLMTAQFGELLHVFSRMPLPIQHQIRDYTRLIQEKTQGFVGRQFVFDGLDRFLSDNPRGYYFIRGDPGIGKTASLAQMVKTRGYVHHFNVRAEGINKSDAFLRNVCAN